jgi:hypothetical protein
MSASDAGRRQVDRPAMAEDHRLETLAPQGVGQSLEPLGRAAHNRDRHGDLLRWMPTGGGTNPWPVPTAYIPAPMGMTAGMRLRCQRRHALREGENACPDTTVAGPLRSRAYSGL